MDKFTEEIGWNSNLSWQDITEYSRIKSHRLIRKCTLILYEMDANIAWIKISLFLLQPKLNIVGTQGYLKTKILRPKCGSYDAIQTEMRVTSIYQFYSVYRSVSLTIRMSGKYFLRTIDFHRNAIVISSTKCCVLHISCLS